MNDFECLLMNLPCIKHLELNTMVYLNFADGQRWQILTHSLITFNFNFNLSLFNIAGVLNSFRTSFWIYEKQWFVAYYNGCLFSVPRFANTHLNTSEWLGLHTTII